MNCSTKRKPFFSFLPLPVIWTNSTSTMYSGKMNKPLIHHTWFYMVYAFIFNHGLFRKLITTTT